MIFTDLHIYTEERSPNAADLFAKYASNIDYVYHLPAGIAPVFIQHAAFSMDEVKANTRMIVLQAPGQKLLHLARLFITVARLKPQVVMLHGMTEPWYNLMAGIIFGRSIKLIVQNHAEKPGRRLRLLFQKMASRYVSAFLFVSQAQAEPWLKKGIIKDRSLVFEVMEGSTTFKVKDKGQPAGQKTIFLWVGRLDANKDPLTILKAFANYVKHNRQVELRMVYNASGLLDAVKAFIAEHALAGYVRLIGALAHSALEQEYNAAHYFILGSHYEGSGYALCEAMACGCVPVVTGIPSFTAMLGQPACGYHFEPGNTVALQQLLLALDPAEHAAMREKVLEKFENDLSFKAIGRRIGAIALQLAAGK